MPQSHYFRVPAIFIACAAALTPGLVVIRPDFVEPLAGWLFVVVIWLGLGATYAYLRDPQRAPLPLLPLTAFFYVIFFALPVFLIESEWWSNGGTAEQPSGVFFERITAETATLVLAALVALIVGYCGLRMGARGLPHFRLSRPVSWLRLRVLLWVCAVAYIVYLYLPMARASSSLTQAMTPIGLFTLGMLFIAWHRGRLNDVEKIIYWAIFVPLAFLIHVYDGLITPIILLFVFLITLYWYATNRASVVLLIVLCASLYVFPVLKLSNFFIVENSPTVAARVSDKMGAIGLASQLFSSAEVPPTIARKNVAQPLLRRLALVVLLQFCVDQTPERIPFLEGETLKNLLTNVVPRVFWPNKPPEVLGQWFGHHYRILRDNDTVTSINLPWLIEFYINFGPLGVVVGMAIVGVLLALAERVLLNPAMTDLEVVTGWALVFRFFYQESNLSLMLGGMITQAVFFLGFVWLAVRLFCRERSGALNPP